MRRRRHLPPPALLEIDEQTFWEKYRPIVEPAEGQAIRGPEPVSYTHLDVYKRQGCW